MLFDVYSLLIYLIVVTSKQRILLMKVSAVFKLVKILLMTIKVHDVVFFRMFSQNQSYLKYWKFFLSFFHLSKLFFFIFSYQFVFRQMILTRWGSKPNIVLILENHRETGKESNLHKHLMLVAHELCNLNTIKDF